MKYAGILAVAVTVFAGGAVFAQDIGPVFDPGFMAGWTGNLAAQKDAEDKAKAAGGKTTEKQGKKAKKVNFAYTPTAALKQKALDGYVARIEKSGNAEAAKVAREQFTKNDANTVYKGLIAGTGLKENDAADALTAYTVLGWMIANDQKTQPPPSGIRAAREAIAAGMAKNEQMTTPGVAASLGEELKLLFVSIHAGWQSAEKEGKAKQYADGVAAMFHKQSGQDLRGFAITDKGFAKKE